MCAGLTKSYKLPTMDSEILQATVDKQQFAVRITAETAAFSRLLARWVLAGASAVASNVGAANTVPGRLPQLCAVGRRQAIACRCMPAHIAALCCSFTLLAAASIAG